MHERRFLIRATEEVPAPPVVVASREWQQAYIGAVFVSVGTGSSPDTHNTALVRALLAAGFSGRHTTFYSPQDLRHLPELAELTSDLWLRSGDGRTPAPLDAHALAVAELLAVGATHTVGVPPPVVNAARATASVMNSLFTSHEIPLPATSAAALPPLDASPAPKPAMSANATQAMGTYGHGAHQLLRAGALAVSLECEQLIDLLCEVTEGARWPDGVPAPPTS
ncbi:hypothetical protein [Streptomyces spongiae]|uniref:Uncharacterized protein n=1 Tax=Streptomyces spongiae TaxID=565072 RepID=A0A5N8XCL2_9ACTN|nr:hypothetical protein [Streptomyces spongiae]MPY57137.1 hypothetical protein [Streptomyces spongiae]